MFDDNRIKIIIGHYGSGKTEFSINYAINLAKEIDEKVVLIDLDIVNLYFRSREKKELLNSLGIKLIASSIDASALDIPAISPEVSTVFNDKSVNAILDIGGDPAGARTLGRYKDDLIKGNYDMFYVLNKNRTETNTPDKAIGYMREIESISRAKVTGIVSNSHLLKSTSIEDILEGISLCEKVSKETNIPIKYITVAKPLEKELREKIPEKYKENIFPIELFMREDWMV